MMSTPQQDVLRFLPHRPPFVMIDDVVAEDSKRARSRFLVQPDNVLVVDGFFSESGLVENIAQTAGAATGLMAAGSGESPSLGYIGALKELRIFELPAVGQTLATEVTFVHQVMQALIVSGAVHCGEKLLATCELKIFLQS